MPDDYIHRQSPGWLFFQHDLVSRARWREWTGVISATEIGVGRVLSAAFAKKGAQQKPLPTYDEVIAQAAKEAPPPRKRTNEWTKRFEQANQVGQFARRAEDDATEHADDPVQDPGG